MTSAAGAAPEFRQPDGTTGADMNMDEEEFSPFGGYSSGCELHGEDFLRECTMCGIEFCSACFPQSTLCADCAAQADLGAEDEEEEPTEEEKELLLLEGFNDDEPESGAAEIPPAPPPAKNKPAAPKTKVRLQAKKTAPKAKVAPKSKAKPASQAKGKSKAKKPAPKKAKAKSKAPAKKKR